MAIDYDLDKKELYIEMFNLTQWLSKVLKLFIYCEFKLLIETLS